MNPLSEEEAEGPDEPPPGQRRPPEGAAVKTGAGR